MEGHFNSRHHFFVLLKELQNTKNMKKLLLARKCFQISSNSTHTLRRIMYFVLLLFFIFFFINTFRNKACAAPPIGHYNGSYTITLKVINVVNIRFIRCKLGSTRSLHTISNKRTNLLFKNHYFLVFKLGGPGSSKHNEGGMGVWEMQKPSRCDDQIVGN